MEGIERRAAHHSRSSKRSDWDASLEGVGEAGDEETEIGEISTPIRIDVGDPGQGALIS